MTATLRHKTLRQKASETSCWNCKRNDRLTRVQLFHPCSQQNIFLDWQLDSVRMLLESQMTDVLKEPRLEFNTAILGSLTDPSNLGACRRDKIQPNKML